MINRLKKIFEAEEIRLIFMGSSVTDGYPYDERVPKAYPGLVEDFLKSRFSNKKIQIENLAGCGEKTAYGLMTCEEKLGKYDSGIVFLDYALNDEASKDWLRMFEGLVRKILAQGCFVPISVVLPGKDRSAAFRYIKKVSEYYRIPCMGIDDMLAELLEQGEQHWEEYYLDATHPNGKGHVLIAQFVAGQIMEALDKLEISPYEMPMWEFFEGSYEPMEMIRIDGQAGYPQTFELECKELWISYVQHYEKDMGKLQVYVDGNLIENLHGRSHFCTYYPVQKKLFAFEQKGRHVITFQMAPGEEGKQFLLEMIGSV